MRSAEAVEERRSSGVHSNDRIDGAMVCNYRAARLMQDVVMVIVRFEGFYGLRGLSRTSECEAPAMPSPVLTISQSMS